MQERKTTSHISDRVFCFVFLALLLGAFAPARGYAMGTEVVGRPGPLPNQPGWAPGVRDALDNENRVYSVWVNGNETFYYRGSIPDMNEALSEFGNIKQKGIRIVVQQGSGQTKMFNGIEVPYDWSVTVPGGLYLQAARLGQLDNPVLVPTFTVCLSGREEPGLPQIRWPKGIPVLDAEALKKAGANATGSEKENAESRPSAPEFAGAQSPIVSGTEETAGTKPDSENFAGTQPADSNDTKPTKPGETPAFVGATEPITSGADNESPSDPQAIGFAGEQSPTGTPDPDVPSSEKELKETTGKQKAGRSIAALFDEEVEPAAKKEGELSSPGLEQTPAKTVEPEPFPSPAPGASVSPTPRPDGPLTAAEQSFLVQRVNSVLDKIRLLDTEKKKPRRSAENKYGVSPVSRVKSVGGASTVGKAGLSSKSQTGSLPPSRFPQAVSVADARTRPDTLTQRTVRAMGGQSRTVSPTSGEILAPSPLQPDPVPGEETDLETPDALNPKAPAAQPRLTVHPLFSAAQDGPLFRVDYTHSGSDELSVAQALKEERLVLDGRELAPLQVPENAGPERLKPGQSWRHTIALSNFLPTTSKTAGGSGSPRPSRGKIALESGEHTLILKFADQASPPLRFEWAGGPLLTE